RRVEHDQLALRLLGRERGLERQAPHLLLQRELVAAHHRAEDHRAAAELRRAQAPLAGAPGALLAPRLLGRALDVADALGLVRARTALGKLPVDHAGEDVATHREPEHLFGEVDAADFLAVEIGDRELHDWLPSAGAGVASGAPPRSAAGNGRSFGALRFTASFT